MYPVPTKNPSGQDAACCIAFGRPCAMLLLKSKIVKPDGNILVIAIRGPQSKQPQRNKSNVARNEARRQEEFPRFLGF